MRCQFGTSNKGRGGRRYLPYVFTEHGAVMLASVLNSPTAIEASIKVVRAFIHFRTIVMLHKDLADRIEELEQIADKHDEKFKVVSHLLGQILGDKKTGGRQIGFIDKDKKE